MGAAECQRRWKSFHLGGGDGQTQGYGCTAIPIRHPLLVVVLLGELALRVGDDALRVAVAERLRRAGLEGALQLHQVKGILGETRAERRTLNKKGQVRAAEEDEQITENNSVT